MVRAPKLGKDALIIVNLSGRGDKDVAQVADKVGLQCRSDLITLTMLVQIQHRFTVEEYYRMAETGVLKPDARVELLDGRSLICHPSARFTEAFQNI